MPLVVHGTTVARAGRGVLIRGRAGAGKSSLALELMALGAELVADDRTELLREGGRVVARCPPAIRGLIEARGVGILRAEAVERAALALVVDLDRDEAERLPPPREAVLLGVPLPCLHKALTGHFAAAIIQYLKSGRSDPALQRPP